MKKRIVLVLIMALSFIFSYNYIMENQVSPPKAVEVDKNSPGNNNGQPPVQEEPAPEDKVSPPANAPADEKQSSTKPDASQNNQASKNGTSSMEPSQTPKENNNEKTANSKGYFVRVDISEQRTYVYKDGKLIRTMICSTGIEEENTKTPRGKYIINETGYKKGEWFYSKKYQEGAKYWVGFIGGTYLFHSIPMDIDKNIIPSEAEKLGTPASHGCIRLSIEDAYWFYKSIPAGSGLSIED